MIDVYNFLWLRIADYGHKYQNGIDVVADFNTRLDEVQKDVYNDLSPYYQTNEKVRALLQPWLQTANGTATASTFTLATATTFDRIVSMGVVDNTGVVLFEINPITEGELVMASRIPQRKPDFSKKRVYYLIDNPNTIILKPLVATLLYVAYYLVYPTAASIAFTFSTTANEDIMTYNSAGSTQLAWNADAANIILYKMLEKYGISNRDLWVSEYAKLGVQMTLGGGGK